MSDLVIGAGQVGTALAEILKADLRDIEPHPGWYDTIHIAFPYSPVFVYQVEKYQAEYDANVVVHSTVLPGTCDPNGWTHSPVRGRHPDLAASLLLFTKLFGGQDAEAHAESWPGSARATDKAVTTEIGKLWELVNYGLNIAAEKAVWQECETWDADWYFAYEYMAHTYNEGYRRMGQSHLTRPILDHMPGPIGGHCVRENMTLIDHPLARIVEDT